MINFLDYLTEATRNNKPKTRLFVIQGSPRTKESCSGGDSKTEFLLKKAADSLPKDVVIDTLDLKILDTEPQVRPCKGCIGTSNGFHCHYPCSCYDKGDGTNDLMHEENVYKRMERADGIAVFTPSTGSVPHHKSKHYSTDSSALTSLSLVKMLKKSTEKISKTHKKQSKLKNQENTRNSSKTITKARQLHSSFTVITEQMTTKTEECHSLWQTTKKKMTSIPKNPSCPSSTNADTLVYSFQKTASKVQSSDTVNHIAPTT